MKDRLSVYKNLFKKLNNYKKSKIMLLGQLYGPMFLYQKSSKIL